ncbi:MAG: S41 family peptidase [Chloroflexota bacterium]
MNAIDTTSIENLSEPEKNFEYLWQTLDRNYGIFGPKRINWALLYDVYRPRVNSQTTDEELIHIMADLIGHLNDNHVMIKAGERYYVSGILGGMEMEDFSLNLIKSTYLDGDAQSRMKERFNFGWLTDSIGYFHFSAFGDIQQSTTTINEITREFKDAQGIIVDVRGNGGGDDRVGKLIADRFADQKRLYMCVSTRNGPKHDDFSAKKNWYVEPAGLMQFTKPVIVLTHRFTISAAENFVLAMRVLPHVTVIGDATSGVFGDVAEDKLPNGWEFRYPYSLFVDRTGFCWEGIGIPADIRQTNSKDNIENGCDKVIQLAIDLINVGSM